MIDPKIVRYAVSQVSNDSEGFKAALAEDVGRALSQGPRGGHTFLNVQKVCANSVSRRITKTWTVIHRAFVTIGLEYSDDLGHEIQGVFDRSIVDYTAEVEAHIQKAAASVGLNPAKFSDPVAEAARLALANVQNEIMLFTLSLQKAPVKENYSPQFNISNSTVGAIQTGSGSIANVSVEIASETAAVIAALDLITKELAKLVDLSSVDKQQILELVDDSKAELLKERPNVRKLSAVLPAISAAISVFADLRPATENFNFAVEACLAFLAN